MICCFGDYSSEWITEAVRGDRYGDLIQLLLVYPAHVIHVIASAKELLFLLSPLTSFKRVESNDLAKLNFLMFASLAIGHFVK